MIKTKINYLKQQTQLHNLAIYGFGQAFNLITPILVIPHIISICTLDNFGKTGFGMSLTFFLIVLIDYGSDINGVKAVAINRNDNAALMQIFAVTYVAKACVLVLVLLVMSLLFFTIPFFSKEKELFFFGLPILLGQFLNPTWFLQGVENFKQITVINILSKILYLSGIFLFINQQSDYKYVNLCWGMGMIIANGISVFQLVKRYSIQFADITKSDIKRHLVEGHPMVYSQIFVSLQLYSPTILIGFFGSNTLVGVYRVVEQVIVIFKTYLLLFFNFVYPKVCYLLANNVRKGLRFWGMYNGANLFFIMVAMCGVHLFAVPIIKYFHPNGLRETTSLLRIAVFVPLLMSITIPLKQLVLGFDFQKFYIRCTVISVILTIVGIVSLLPFYQNKGVIIALIGTEFITGTILFFKIKSRLFVS